MKDLVISDLDDCQKDANTQTKRPITQAANRRSKTFQQDATPEVKRPVEATNRRSKTFPLLNGMFTPSKHRSVRTWEPVDLPESPESPMEFQTESNPSYDLLEFLQDDCDRSTNRFPRQKRESIYEKPPRWADGPKSKSLVNLPGLFKKDKTLVNEEEVMETSLDDTATVRRAPHRRQKSLPVPLTNDVQVRKQEERVKRRQTFMGFLKLFQFQTVA